MKVLVTGGCGFLGFHICQHYLNLGADAVTAGDQDGVAVIFFEEFFVVVEPEQPGESVGQVQDPGAVRFADVSCD